MLKLAAQPYLMFAENIKTFGWWTKFYVTIFGKKIICVDKMLDGNTMIDTVCTIEIRTMRNGNIYIMSEKYEHIQLEEVNND